MKQKLTRPNIFDYHDYIEFLKDWSQFLRKAKPSVSLRQLAEKADLATGMLPMCLSRKRRLSYKSLLKLLPHLKLNSNEQRYFELIWTISESEDQTVRINALKKIQKFSDYNENNKKEVEAFTYLTKWYYVAIREMSYLKNFKDDPKWIQSKIKEKLSIKQIKEALDFLKENQYLIKQKDGQFRAPDKSIDCKEGVYKLSLSEFHRQIFNLAISSIESTPRDKRTISGYTMPIKNSDLPKLKRILDKTMTEISNLSCKETTADVVYHFELAAFPLTTLNKGDEK